MSGAKTSSFLQEKSASDADRFLAFADVNAAGDPAAAIHAGEFFFECARQQHPAKGLEIFFVEPALSVGIFAFGRAVCSIGRL